MRITLDIKENKAIAFLNFIQSLDFVTIDEKVYEVITLTSKQKKAIDEGLKQIEEGKIISNENVMSELKNRHPKYFK
ncbi:MAG: hypothetical protein V4622_04700 [Bacteroidota bacterium]